MPVPAAVDLVTADDETAAVELAAAVSLLPPSHRLVVAFALAVELSWAHHARRLALADAGLAIAPVLRRYDGGRGYAASWVPREEIQRRREPGPLASKERA